MPQNRSIRVAGAGPAGLAAAIALARAGRQVEVHEAKPDVGTRFIGDLQIIESASDREPVPAMLERIGIRTNFFFKPANWATFYDRRSIPRGVRSAEPYGWFVRRGAEDGTLDRGLAAQARDAGATLVFNSRLAPEDADIVATGPATPDGLAREMAWKTDEPERVDVLFNHRLAPGGYAYLLIIEGTATFGCAIVADFKRIDHYFDSCVDAVQRMNQFSIPQQTRNAYSYMNFHLKRTAKSNGTRFAGEAGGFQDYLFGLGIRYALTTGYLAARSILEERDFDMLWREALAEKQESSLVNRFLYESGGNLGLSIFVRRAAKAHDFRSYLGRWNEQRWWKSLLSPFIRHAWRHEGSCAHKPADHWCRARETEMQVPET